MSEIMKSFFDSKLATGEQISILKKDKKKTSVSETISVGEIEEREKKGWRIQERKGWKNKVIAIKDKSHNDLFEDVVWCLFADMGFKYLNADRRFILPYGENLNNSSTQKQIDVFAADDESVFLVECKSASSPNKRSNFKTAIEAIKGNRGQLINNIKEQYPQFQEHNFKYIFATSNYILSPNDLERMRELGIYHISHDILKYYQEQVSHIGIASRYQFLANVFKGKSVKMDTTVPAISGTMGGKKYYSFAIEPSRLLKISRVLHKNIKPDTEDRTYQRIIKKDRLNEIRRFIDNGGYFPNSLLVNITSKNGLKFSPVEKEFQRGESKTRLGLLQLPKEYGCAYIIDGQHRLYGYIGTKYADSNTIPVILFEGLDGTEQVRLFMEINEKQKSVPKNLRHVLNADLLWDDKDANKRLDSLKLRIAQLLGDREKSPLHDCVNQGEESTADGRYVTIDMIKAALDKSCFFSRYKNNKIEEFGVLDRGCNEDTLEYVLSFLLSGLSYMYEQCPSQWQIEERGFFATNAGVGAFLRIMSDVARSIKLRGVELLNCRPEEYRNELTCYLKPLADYFANMTPEEREKLETRYGSKYGQGGPLKYWRSLQRVIKDARDDFSAIGLEEYETSKMLKYNEETSQILSVLLEGMQNLCSEVLNDNFGTGEDWLMQEGMPEQIYASCVSRAVKYKKETGQSCDIARFLTFDDIRSTVSYKDNWGKLFQTVFTLSEPQYAKGTKSQKLAWLSRLKSLENLIAKRTSVSQEDYDFVVRLRDSWLPNL